MAYPMGASKRGCRRVDFDRHLKLELHGFKVTTGAGFLAYRELDDALERTEMAGDVFCDNRTGKNAWHGMTGQFRQSLFGRQWGMTTWTMPTVWDAIPPCVGLSAARPSDGCKEDGVSLPLDQWYDFQEFGCHLGNVGSSRSWRSLDRPVSLLGKHYMKVAAIVGARPQFIKAAVVSRHLRKQLEIRETLVHAGQH